MKEKSFLTEETLVSLVRDNATTLCHILNNAILMSQHTEDAKDVVTVDLPDFFRTEKAESLFAKLCRAGILDRNNMPIGLSMARKGVLASIIADRLGITNLWAAFGHLWNINRNTLHKGFDKGIQQRSMSLFIDAVNNSLNND